MILVIFPPSLEKKTAGGGESKGEDCGRRTSEAVGLMVASDPSFFFMLSIFVFLNCIAYATCSPLTLLFIAGNSLYNPPPATKEGHWA